MGTKYKAKAQRVCWKQHTCVTCGSVYRYRFSRSVEATAATPLGAQQQAAYALDQALTNGVDIRACPHCGLIQPEMIGQKRSDAHGCMIGLSFLLLVVLWVIYGYGWAQYQTLGYIALAVGGFIAFKHILAAVQNPNHDLAANKTKAVAEVQKGDTLLVEQGSDPGLDSVPTDMSRGMKFAILLLLASLVLFPAAELLRMASGWPYNAHCSPPVGGPGETIRFYTGDSITSIKGYWDGQVQLKTQNEAELALESNAFTASTHQQSWAYNLYSKASENHDSSDMYVDIAIPDIASLEGKSATLDITLDVASPQVSIGNQFRRKQQQFKSSLRLTITTRESGRRYLIMWWIGMAAGLFFQIVAGLVLNAKAASLKKGLPTQLIPM